MGYRLLALDIDGTLLRSDKEISPRTQEAVRAAQSQGVRVVLVTGRRYPSALRVARLLGDKIPLVLHNGALIIDEGEVVRCLPLSLMAACRAIDVGKEHGADAVVHAGHKGEGLLLVESGQTQNTLLAYYLDKSHPDVVSVPCLKSALSEDPLQVMFGGGMEAMAELREHLLGRLSSSARVERTVYPSLGIALLDVVNPAVYKAQAVKFLEGRWGVAPAETLAIGDNWNDHEMLKGAGLGLVMGNAEPALRDLGLGVLPSNDEDGVAVAIETHIMGR